jgi:hypothetical protein
MPLAILLAYNLIKTIFDEGNTESGKRKSGHWHVMNESFE